MVISKVLAKKWFIYIFTVATDIVNDLNFVTFIKLPRDMINKMLQLTFKNFFSVFIGKLYRQV